MKKVLIIAPNFLPESVGGASRIYEMAKKMKDEFDVVIMNDRMSRAKKEILTIVKNFIKK